MVSACSRSAPASSKDVETSGTILRGNRNRREKMTPKERMRLRISINAISIDKWTMTGRESTIEGLGWSSELFSVALKAAVMQSTQIFPHAKIFMADFTAWRGDCGPLKSAQSKHVTRRMRATSMGLTTRMAEVQTKG